MDNSQEILVSVGVITYNQEHYIRQCLDSILMQTVDFTYEIVIGDDCSSDSTPDILNEYKTHFPDRINLILNGNNSGISANYKNVLQKCKGKYIALCEGDDYWLNTTRLQEQIEFLEGHPDYGFVGGNVIILNGQNTTFESYDYLHDPIIYDGKWELYGSVLDYAKHGPVTRTVTICFRKSIINPFISIKGIGNDLVLQTILSKFSFFAKTKDAIGVYRQSGISNNRFSIESITRYAEWRYECLSLQKRLFPMDCNWDEDEMNDNRYYSVMRYYIRHFQYLKAKKARKMIKSVKFKRKVSYRFSNNIVSCCILGICSQLLYR